MLVYSFMKLNLSWYFSSWKLLQVDYFFKKLNTSWFMSSRNFLYFYLILIKLVACWFFSLWKVYIDLSPLKSIFSWNLKRADYCSRRLIHFYLFLCESPFIIIYSVVLLNLLKYFSSWNLSHVSFSSWKMMLTVHENCYKWIISSKNRMYLYFILWEIFIF